MTKKSGYKYQIEKALNLQNWEVVAIDSNNEWWDDENWRVEYQYDPALSFYLCFIVDPAFEGQRKKGQGLYLINASTKFPESWNDMENTIASISLTKRKFDVKLKEFLADLDTYKKGNNHK